jgi:hypothetical protein
MSSTDGFRQDWADVHRFEFALRKLHGLALVDGVRNLFGSQTMMAEGEPFAPLAFLLAAERSS